MKDFFKYLTAGSEDKDWGLFVNVVGRSRILPNTAYPSIEHPTGYYFDWKKGRVLQEFQLNYISEGAGIFENELGQIQIKPGTFIIVRPGQWHRYRPKATTGWVENYIGFDGDLAHHFLEQSTFSSDSDIIIGRTSSLIIDTYFKIFSILQEEKPGCQQVASGLIVKLLGQIISIEKQKNFSGKHIEKVIQEVRMYMREHIEDEMSLIELAKEHHVGYSYFRKMFKKYTGVSPHQYHLDMTIMRAKELLLTTDKSISEISSELGFQSIFYFSRLFKKKTGICPSEFRKLVI